MNPKKENTKVNIDNKTSNTLTLYHGSRYIIKQPKFGAGKRNNDFGLGFYCTKNLELAKEWACPIRQDGFANVYSFDATGLKIIDLTSKEYNIINWLALLLKNREFDVTGSVAGNAREYIIENYTPALDTADVVIGYRADDSYFKFASDFLRNSISLRDLEAAMRLGDLGLQFVLKSKKSFSGITYQNFEPAPQDKYYFSRIARDKKAREKYLAIGKNPQVLDEDIFAVDILRRRIKSDDPRIRPNLP